MILAVVPIESSQPWWVLGFALLIGHAVADYPLQGNFLAQCKNHRLPQDARPPGVKNVRGLWFHCLTYHALIHAGTVWIISGTVLLGLVEFALHWIIDFLKSAGVTNFHVDQLLHMLCKAGYVALFHFGLFGF